MNIKRYLPSHKIRRAIVILCIVGIAYLAFSLIQKYYTNNSLEKTIEVSFVNEEKLNGFYTRDSDNDGAYDWEEALWAELDPYNPDSDGDGVLDGKYIAIKNAIKERERTGAEAPIIENLSESTKLARSLGSALLAIEQSGQTLSSVSEAQISKNVVGYITDLSFGKKVYTRDELLLVANTRTYSYAYTETMRKLFVKYPVATSDIELLIDATQNPSEYQGQLSGAYLKYQDYNEELATLQVPYAIGSQHTRLLNIIGQIEAALGNLLEEEPDELTTLATLVQLESILNQTADAIIKINLYFNIIDNLDEFDEEI